MLHYNLSLQQMSSTFFGRLYCADKLKKLYISPSRALRDAQALMISRILKVNDFRALLLFQ